jgi:hypothetical protein
LIKMMSSASRSENKLRHEPETNLFLSSVAGHRIHRIDRLPDGSSIFAAEKFITRLTQDLRG